MIRVKEVLEFLERGFADVTRQYDWDNSGRQLVLDDQKVQKAALALDPTEKVIEQAIKEGCELLITHHPLFFGKVKSLDHSKPFDRKVIKAVRGNLSIISAHTSLDLADYSLNDYLAELLGSSVISDFVTEGREELLKFAVFVPADHAEAVRDAMINAGGGHIGNYSGCTFSIPGQGTFMPGEGTDPFIGEKGRLEKLSEVRIETIIPKSKLNNLLKEVIKAHPYEEVAHDIYKLDMGLGYGLGRVCGFDNPVDASDFLALVRDRLGADTLRINMSAEGLSIDRFAVVTGSGASMWKKCLSAGVKVLLTGDMKHHDALDAAENGVMIVDAGHFETERVYMSFLAGVLEKELKIKTVLMDEKPSITYWR